MVEYEPKTVQMGDMKERCGMCPALRDCGMVDSDNRKNGLSLIPIGSYECVEKRKAAISPPESIR